MKIDIGPTVEDCLLGRFDGPRRTLEIPDKVLAAEEQFFQALPRLLQTKPDHWVVVTHDGKCFDDALDPDRSELAAQAAGYTLDEYVVRLVVPADEDS